jgi:hypothetical protein
VDYAKNLFGDQTQRPNFTSNNLVDMPRLHLHAGIELAILTELDGKENDQAQK